MVLDNPIHLKVCHWKFSNSAGVQITNVYFSITHSTVNEKFDCARYRLSFKRSIQAKVCYFIFLYIIIHSFNLGTLI